MEKHPVAAIGSELGRALLEGEPLDAAVEQLCRRCAELIPGAQVRIDAEGDLHVDRDVALTAEEQELADALRTLASVLLDSHHATADAAELAGQLQVALDSRVIIEQAKGMLAGALGTDPAEAFEALRSFARRRGMRIHDLAREIVERRLPPAVLGGDPELEAAE